VASIFKPKGKTRYVILYHDETGRRRKKTGATDKAVTQRIARDIEIRVALRREGLIDLAAESFAASEARPLSAHLDEFRKALRDKGNTPKHADVTSNRAARVLTLAGARRISDLSPSRVLDALAALRTAEGLGAETVNHHIRAVKAFSRWLWKDGRAREHYLAHLATTNPEADRRHRRRVLTPDEAARLIRAAERGPVVKGLSGPDRARCYALALGTGLRASELASLTPERFDLAADLPTVTVPAGYTKNGKEAVQPLPGALAASLCAWLATLPPGRPVFPLPEKTAEMIRADLAAAGIPYETDAGVADFHALRAAYVSNLVASGASVKTCQVLARHSTPTLTIGVYARASLHDVRGAVEALPDLTPGADRPEAMAATGTDGGPGRAATQTATPPADAPPQVLIGPFLSTGLASDLKSSPGEPGCGFESHRRHWSCDDWCRCN
jgi:integrase